MRNDLETIKAELTRLQRRIANLPATDRLAPGADEADSDAVFTSEEIRKLGNTIADARGQILCAETATYGYNY
mgnify:CR=1 FL=1|jgi:hypothetical protein